MKLHNLSVIFVIIAIPLILITSYYISLQIDTINMQTAYNTKLLDSTKEAIDAFEINTVEWNANYSETADSKRRDIMASINTFTSSFANNIGVGGASKEYIMAYMPAIAYTLYDGYYIYSPANTKVAITDENGVGLVMTEKLCDTKVDNNKKIIESYTYNENDEGKLLYKVADGKTKDGTYNGTPFTLNQENADTEYNHILKPFAMYSEKIGDWVINYTLDNYITIYGNVKNEETGNEEFVSKSGYLTDLSKIEGINNNSVRGILFNGIEVKPEELSEKIAYKENESSTVDEGVFSYVYESDGNTKVYFDEGNNAFIVGSDLVKINLSNNINRYKKVTIPQYKSGQWTYKEVYQSLCDGKWYDKEKKNVIAESNSSPSYDIEGNKKFDYSAINYCVESYIVTKFVNGLDLNPNNSDGNCVCGYSHGNNKPLSIGVDNNPESKESYFSIHKRGIIKNVVESNLNQAITSYSRNSNNGDYKLPKLTETDWDQILRNVSIITFIQNIPIGMKYYNNYAIATSTMNKEYVDPEEIYLNATGDEYYHMPYCKELTKTYNMIGYRSIDYVQKSYTQKKELGEDETKYYYKHSNTGNIDVNQACYYCLVQKSLYKENKTDNKAKAYYTALARERYVARMAKLPAEVEASYYINVTPYTVKDEKEIEASSAKYHINEILNTGKINKILNTGKSGVKIDKKAEKYIIEPNFGEEKTLSEDKITEKLGSFNDTAETKSGADFGYSVYKSDSYAEVQIEEYEVTKGIKFSVKASEWTAGYSTDTKEQLESFSPEADGYINIRLKYEKNYEAGDENSGITAFANIDNSSELTIVTNTGKITGLVRLKFTNTNNEGKTITYYSKDIFNIKNTESSIYCKIEDTDSWYRNDWRVDILNVAGGTIKSTNKMEYYTVRAKEGLEAFSQATNNGAKTKERKFYLIEDLNMNEEVLNPICQNTTNWFDGYFGSGIYHAEGGYVEQGGQHTISNLKINVNNDAEPAFGLFGWVGEPATIENLKISNIKISPKNGKYKAGGLAGFADAGNSINNVIVEKSSIIGSAYVGGIVGHSKKQINNSTISNTTVSSQGTRNIIELKGKKYNIIYVGGIAGLTEEQASINNCKITASSKIGEGSITINNNNSYNKDRYYVGGIVGYATNTVNSPTVEESITVEGGAIKGTAWDENKETYTGGVIGYKDTSQQINGSFSVNCTVSGHDNVGGIIGFNAGGDINDVSFNGTIQGDGENIGGIVGCNTGGSVSSCTNTVTIDVTGENVGGIVGCNYNANVLKCYNNANVTGNKNVGGIVGVCYGGTIDYCGNNKLIEGKKNTNYLGFYYTGPSDCTGTGGITGKLYRAKVLHTYNSGDVNCNYNGGGISGINNGSTVEYSYNSGTISSDSRNRIGGICGAGNTVYINACYNIGTVNGNGDIDVLSNGMGGIIGTCVDNSYFIYIGKEEILPENKYFDSIEVPVVKSGQSVNVIIYCYNTGDLNNSTGSDTLNHACGIAGCIMWAPNKNDITLANNYYLENVEKGAKGSWSNIVSNGVTRLSSQDMKQQLYKWADSSLKIESNYVYNTITPLETDNKGYEGYGVLWWELENNYSRIETYICSGYSYNGNTRNYLPIRDTFSTEIIFKNGDLKITKTLDDKLNRKEYIEHNNAKYHCWVMMIKNGTTYDIGATAKNYGTRYKSSYTVEKNDKILIVLPTGVNEVILSPSNDASVIWDRFETSVERPQRIYYGYWGAERRDKDTGSQQVKAYYSGKIDKSKENDNHRFTLANLLKDDNSFGSIYLDGNGEGKNTTAILDTYYKDKYQATNLISTQYKYEETLTITGDTEKIKGKSGCKVSIPIQNIQTATSEQALPFYEDVSTIESAQARVKVGIYLNDSIWDKLDWAHVSTFKDDIKITASFAGKEKTETRKIPYKWNYTEKNIQWFDMNIDITNIGTKEIPDKIEVTMEWDATVIGINVAIDKADVLVRYTLSSEE